MTLHRPSISSSFLYPTKNTDTTMLSIVIQSGAAANSVLTHSSFPYQKTLLVKPSKSATLISPVATRFFTRLNYCYYLNGGLTSPNSNFSNPSTMLHQKTKPISRISRKQRTFAAPETLADIPPSTIADVPIPTPVPERVEVVVKQVEKPRLVLKFIWMEKNIGLGLDQVIPGHGTVPLSPYFFWPRKDAWEELKTTLESKPWISQKKMIILLNQATDIINLWQQSGGNITT